MLHVQDVYARNNITCYEPCLRELKQFPAPLSFFAQLKMFKLEIPAKRCVVVCSIYMSTAQHHSGQSLCALHSQRRYVLKERQKDNFEDEKPHLALERSKFGKGVVFVFVPSKEHFVCCHDVDNFNTVGVIPPNASYFDQMKYDVCGKRQNRESKKQSKRGTHAILLEKLIFFEEIRRVHCDVKGIEAKDLKSVDTRER